MGSEPAILSSSVGIDSTELSDLQPLGCEPLERLLPVPRPWVRPLVRVAVIPVGLVEWQLGERLGLGLSKSER
jgi:hypothetical protein